MPAQQHEPTLDLDEYRADTAELVESIDETTVLVGEMADNMDRLRVACRDFAEDASLSAGAGRHSRTRQVAVDGGRVRSEE